MPTAFPCDQTGTRESPADKAPDGCEGARMPAHTKSIAVKSITLTNLLTLAFLNMRRHGFRAVVNIAGIAIAVGALSFFLSFYRGTYENVMFSSVIDYATSHGQFMSTGLDDDDPDTWLDAENLLDEGIARQSGFLETVAGERAIWSPALAPRLMAPAFAGDGSRKAPVIVAGVNFANERSVLDIDARMSAGDFGGDGVVIGQKLADTLSLRTGDEIRIQANASDGIPNLDYWKIAGIYSTGYPPMDRGMVFMNLAEAQTFLAAQGKINKIYCRLSADDSSLSRERTIRMIDESREQLADLGLSFRSWQNYARFIVEDAKSDGIFFTIFIAILLFLSLSTMAGTMRVTVFERKREIGMLRASGWTQKEIAVLFLLESFLIGLAGSILGALAGGALSLALRLHPIVFAGAMPGLDIPSFSLTCDLAATDTLISLMAGFLTALLSGFMPALSGARMPILTALSER